MLKIVSVLQKLLSNSKRLFMSQITIIYELNVSHFGIAPRENTLESILRRRHNNFLDERLTKRLVVFPARTGS